MARRVYGWEPPEELLTHSGDDFSRQADFFADPPEELGEITSACTTLTYKKTPMSPVLRATIMAISGAGGAFIGLVIALLADIRMLFFAFAWPAGLGGLGLLIAWACTRFSHTCTYVGRAGIARFSCTGSRDNVTEEVFEFRDAEELRTRQVRRYTNGVYQGTDYTYTWTDVGGRTRFLINGTHKSESGHPGSLDMYHFATSAEMAWSLSLLDQVDRQLTTRGEIRFSLSGSDYVSVGKGYLRLSLSGRVTERDTEDIDSVSVRNGVFVVKEIGAKEGWFSSSGVFKFNYDNLANAQLFMFVLDKVAGLRIE